MNVRKNAYALRGEKRGMETFSGYITAMRKRSGITLREMAARLDISPAYYCDVEKGRRHPLSFHKLEQFGQIAGMERQEVERMLDLAGAARGTIAPDIADYIAEHEGAVKTLRLARNLGAANADWDYFADMLRTKYPIVEPEN